MPLERTACFPKWALRHRGCPDSCPQCLFSLHGNSWKVNTDWLGASITLLWCSSLCSLLWHSDLTVLGCRCWWDVSIRSFQLLCPPSNINGTCHTILKMKQPENKQMKQLFQLRNKDPFRSWVPICQTAADAGVQILCSSLACASIISTDTKIRLKLYWSQREYSCHSGYRI